MIAETNLGNQFGGITKLDFWQTFILSFGPQVMKDWSDLEERYQDMRAEDPSQAEDFKKQMTERFQKTVQALEEESSAKKRQLLAMHQQRVISRWLLLPLSLAIVSRSNLPQDQPAEEGSHAVLHKLSE